MIASKVEPPIIAKSFTSQAVGGGLFEVICIGVSTGGPKALNAMLPTLCSKTNAPILIVQHMPPGFTESLASGLDKKCGNYSVTEAKDGTFIEPNRVYIAPGGEHLVVRKVNGTLVTGLHAQPPENGCRPSVDVLFRSVAQSYGGTRILAMVLTGMGCDGTAGLRPLKRAGAIVVTQNESSSVVYGMPKAAFETGLVDKEGSLMDLPNIVETLQR